MRKIKIGTSNGIAVYYSKANEVVFLERGVVKIYNIKTIEQAIERSKVNLKNFKEA